MKANLTLRLVLIGTLILTATALVIAPNRAAPPRDEGTGVPEVGTQGAGSALRAVEGYGAATPTDPFGVYFTYAGAQPLGGQQMAAAGATWAQVHIQWADIESQPGVYNWTSLDARLSNLASLGFKAIITVNGNPSWAAEWRCGPLYPEHVATFASFLAAAVARYSVAPYNVLYWSLYNEADNGDPIDNGWLGGCGGTTRPNHAAGAGGAAYAAMLKVVYPAMKAANPNVQVLLTGLAYDWFTPKGLFDPDFVDDIMAAGGGPYFDAVNFHYFHGWKKSWTTADRYNTGVPRKAQRLRQTVAAYGFQKPLVLTELGHPTDATDPVEDAKLSEDLSARLVWQLYAQSMSAGISPITWLQAVDESWLPYSHGLLREDLTPKLTYTAFQAMTTELAGAHFSTVRRDYESDVMGYDFVVGSQTKTLVWVTTETQKEQVFPLAAAGQSLRVVDKLGVSQVIVDGGSGDLDGLVNGSARIAISADPRLVVLPFLAPTLTPTPTATFTPTPSPTPRASATPQTGAKTRSFQYQSSPKANYTGAADAFVSEQQAATNYGAAAPLVISGSDPVGSNKDKWGLMKWVLSATNGTIQSASMTLNITDHSGGQGYDLVEALANWNETTVAWNAKPAAGATVLGTAAPAKTGPLTINLNASGIAVLQKWLTTPSKNYGFYLLKSSATDTLRLDAREAATASLRPKLTITFVPPILSKAPWVQNLTKTTATVLWETDVFTVSTLKYRKKGVTTWTTKKATTTLVSSKWQAKGALSGLATATDYEYQVRASADSPWTGILSFKTTATAPPALAPQTSDQAAAEMGQAPVAAAEPSGYLLAIPERLQAEAGQVQAPVWLRPGSGEVSGLAFALTYDPRWLVFDPADADDDGIPDAVNIYLTGDFGVEVDVEGVGDDRNGAGAIVIRLLDLRRDLLADLEGPLLDVTFLKGGSDAEATVSAPTQAGDDRMGLGFAPGSTLFDAVGGSHSLPVAIEEPCGAEWRWVQRCTEQGETVEIWQTLKFYMPRLLN